MENMLHTWFQGKRVKNEWFELDLKEVTSFNKSCEEIEKILETMEDNYFFKKKYGTTAKK